MAEEKKESLALALDAAKRDLKAQISQAANAHARLKGAFEVEMDLYEKRDRSVVGDNASLISQIHALVDTFDQQEAVRQAGVRVQRIGVIDSNGDGNAAVNVMFDHAGYQ